MKSLPILALLCLSPALLAAPQAAGSGAGEHAPRAAADAGLASTHWGREYFPNVPLTTHEGEEVLFFDLIEGKVVVINFIYTSCPDACPLETARLDEVYRLLGEPMGEEILFLSVSIDPARDTPEVLAEYRERFRIGDGWLFLTGTAANIEHLRKKLGMIDRDEEELSDHTLSLLIGNQSTGQWMKSSPFQNAQFLAQQIGGQLRSYVEPLGADTLYEDAPEIGQVTRGESLFRTRCMSCHLIGPEDGMVRQGPNLTGVTDYRDHDWLRRWMAEPDVMLAEGDPVAVGLFEAYNRVPMPNLRLTSQDVDALMVYLAEESAYHLGTTAEPQVSDAEDDEWGEGVEWDPSWSEDDWGFAEAGGPRLGDLVDDGGWVATADEDASAAALEIEPPSCCAKDDRLVLSGGEDEDEESAEESEPVEAPPVSAPPADLAAVLDDSLEIEPPSCCAKDEQLVLSGTVESDGAARAPHCAPDLARVAADECSDAADCCATGDEGGMPLPSGALALAAGLSLALGLLGMTMFRGQGRA